MEYEKSDQCCLVILLNLTLGLVAQGCILVEGITGLKWDENLCLIPKSAALLSMTAYIY